MRFEGSLCCLSAVVLGCWSDCACTQMIRSDLRYTLFYATEPPLLTGTAPVRLVLISSSAFSPRPNGTFHLHLPLNRNIRLEYSGLLFLFNFVLGVCTFQGSVSIKVRNTFWSLTVFYHFWGGEWRDRVLKGKHTAAVGEVCPLPAHVDSTAAGGW